MHNRYYLMRHGESEANVRHIIVSDPKTGTESFGLTSKGEEQIRHSVNNAMLPKDTVCVYSDFLRTKETAEMVQKTLRNKSMVVEKGLRERFFGRLEQQSADNYQKVWEVDSKDPVSTPFGAESPTYLALRLKRTLQKLEKRFQDETLLLISHGDPLRYLQLSFTGLRLAEIQKVPPFDKAEIRKLNQIPGLDSGSYEPSGEWPAVPVLGNTPEG